MRLFKSRCLCVFTLLLFEKSNYIFLLRLLILLTDNTSEDAVDARGGGDIQAIAFRPSPGDVGDHLRDDDSQQFVAVGEGVTVVGNAGAGGSLGRSTLP